MKSLICILLLTLTGCASIRDVARSSLTREERLAVISRARTIALESGVVRESERAAVESGDPKLAYYFMAGVHYAQYSITWTFSDHEGVTVHGQGDMLLLDGAKVKRLPNQVVQRTGANRFAQSETLTSSAAGSRR